MIENCYILYSCDGSYEPIVSNYSGLSAYSESFVSVNIIDLGTTPDTCFYVLSLGEIECQITYDIDVNYRINWQHYKNTILLTQHDELKQLRTKIYKIVEL